jgi:hypothetical protein
MRHVRRGATLSVAVMLVVAFTCALWLAPAKVAAAGESVFVPVTPCRLADTRGNGFLDPFGPPALAAGVPRDVPVQFQCGILAAASAVSLNVTATNTQGPAF